MSILKRARDSLTAGLRRAGNAGGLYAPTGTGGGWTGIFNLGHIANRATGHVHLSEEGRLQHNVGVVHVAVNRIAEDVSSLGVRVEVARRGGKWVPDPAHPLQRLLDQPVPWAEGTELRHVLQQHLCLLGRAAVLVVDGTGGEPRELHLLYPQRLDALPDPVNFLTTYRYQGLSGRQQYFPAFAPKPHSSGLGVMEVRIPDPINPYAGNSAVQAGGNSITLDAEIRAYARFYFANNAMPGAVLESDQPHPGVESARNQRESWNEQYQGVYNAGKIATLWGGLKLRTMAPAFKDLEFPEITKASRQDILMHFGVPGPVVGYTDTGALGADTFSAARAVYQSQTLDPHRKRLERFLNRLAARWPGCRVVIESPVEEDLVALEKRQLEELKAGGISREEYRTARGYEPDGQPDVWLLPGSVRVVHALTPEGVAAAPRPEPQPNAPPEPEEVRTARYRALWAEEYRRLRDAPDEERPNLPPLLHARWQQEGEHVASLAAQMRQAALEVSGGDLVLAYEALKAEARALAEVERG